jgi:hypothetical protein
MQPSDYSLAERVQTSFTRLSSAATELNKASGELGQAIYGIDAILQRLNLGVPTWAKIHEGQDPENGDYWSREVGYAKIGNKWGIALRTVEGNLDYPEGDHGDSWLFNDAPRWLRVEGIEKIPDLLDDLIRNTERTTQTIKSKIDQANRLAAAIAQAAAIAPPPPPPPPPMPRNRK